MCEVCVAVTECSLNERSEVTCDCCTEGGPTSVANFAQNANEKFVYPSCSTPGRQHSVGHARVSVYVQRPRVIPDSVSNGNNICSPK